MLVITHTWYTTIVSGVRMFHLLEDILQGGRPYVNGVHPWNEISGPAEHMILYTFIHNISFYCLLTQYILA
jgi:hypothetical protein